MDNPSPTPLPYVPSSSGYKFPYPILVIIFIWILLAIGYMISRWRQRPKNMYIIPRVFVLCSPRTVQFHYELILRVGLASYEFNPDKHDIDITVHGQQKNEVVPMTRINTKTLIDEPLITSLSIIVYRLVEMPPLGHLVLRHSGPFKAWLYVYDFTVIDLSTNKEHYYTINQYIGSLNRDYTLEDSVCNVHYPIDDVPLPQWAAEDIYMILFSIINCIALSMSLLPINCSYLNDIASIGLATLNGYCTVFFLEYILYYYARWNQDRREYFNYEEGRCWPPETIIRAMLIIISSMIGACAIYYSIPINQWRESLIWILATSNTSILVIGLWNISRQIELGEAIVTLGLKIRGVESELVGMKYSEMTSDMHTKSGSASDDGGGSSISAPNSRMNQSFGPRSSVKSFGFDPITGSPHRTMFGKIALSRLSNTGATPNNQPRFHHSRPILSQIPSPVSLIKGQAHKKGSDSGQRRSKGSKRSKGSGGKEGSVSKELSKKLVQSSAPHISTTPPLPEASKQSSKELKDHQTKASKDSSQKELSREHKEIKGAKDLKDQSSGQKVHKGDQSEHKEHREELADKRDRSSALQKH